MERALQLITTEPEMFAKYDEHRRFTLVRRFPYSVVYEIQEGQVQIIAVAHASRRPGYWQDRR